VCRSIKGRIAGKRSDGFYSQNDDFLRFNGFNFFFGGAHFNVFGIFITYVRYNSDSRFTDRPVADSEDHVGYWGASGRAREGFRILRPPFEGRDEQGRI